MNSNYLKTNDSIVALSTPQGMGAIALIRLSGQQSISIIEKIVFSKSGKRKILSDKPSHSAYFGIIKNGDLLLDEVIITLFRNPNSFTGEDVVEISCHGSTYIQQQILQLLLTAGARMAEPGEFTFRAFMNGKMDLSQAEAVSDLIASNSAISHQVAISQMRGGFSNKIKVLRNNLIDFASLIELELDFSEEDVEFANRDELKKLITTIQSIIEKLIESFEVGNVIKNGIPVAIVGKPNAGKSTLLNVLLNEEKAIVSEIPGTTRDLIEDTMIIDGVLYRFIDTAGIRDTSDVIEQIGVNRALDAIKNSAIVIYLFDAHELGSRDLAEELSKLKEHIGNSQLVIVCNKIDKEDLNSLQSEFQNFENLIFLSAKEKMFIEDLKNKLVALFDSRTVNLSETIVTNARHADALRKANSSLYRVMDGLGKHVPGDLLSQDIRFALDSLGQITGNVGSEELLSNIFSRFCIGK